MQINYQINEEILQDCINISVGLFKPLKGFMNSYDYKSVIENMQLSNGMVWTIPITLDVNYETYIKAKDSKRLNLFFNKMQIGFVDIEDCFEVNIINDLKKIYKTAETKHPGVKKEIKRTQYRIGGPITVTDKSLCDKTLNPIETKAFFKSQGWQTIAGFQTRNPIHKAHEYLQRVALEQCDALFINPLVGWKKKGDFSEEAVIDGYKAMLKNYFVNLNVYFDTLKTPMRYAGPREAIFHAIIRRNMGCTHFIIGRDHAGVQNYYGKYEAHELAKKIINKHDIGIKLLLLKEPFYCQKCSQIVSDNTCGHQEQYIKRISGTKIRNMLSKNKYPDELFMRKEIADAIIKLGDKKFIKD